MSRKIITELVLPPVPFRHHDYASTYDGYEPGDLVGFGATEQESINDLLEQTNQQKEDQND